jgi:hypothetical protein
MQMDTNPAISPEELVRELFERVHASDPAVRDLYAQDAVRIDHHGQRFEGRDAIGQFYESLFPVSAPHPEIESLLVNPPFVAALMRLPEHHGGARYVDLLEIADGEIRSLRVMFPRAGSSPDAASQ